VLVFLNIGAAVRRLVPVTLDNRSKKAAQLLRAAIGDVDVFFEWEYR